MDEKELKEELDTQIGDREQQLLVTILDEIKRLNIINSKDKKEELQQLHDRIIKLTEDKTETLIQAISELANITKGIKITFPEEFKVKVANQLQFPKSIEISNQIPPIPHPKEIELKKPKWWEQITKQNLAESIEDLIKAVKDNKKPNLEAYREPKKALAVRLVNRRGTDFYEALAAAIGGMSRSSFPFENASGTAKAARVDAQGDVQVDIKSEAAPTTLLAFITGIPTATTRVQLATNTVIAGVIQAPSTNTGNVFIGGSNVSSTVFGSELQPGQSVGVAINNTDKIWIDAATSGDDVAFFGS